MTDSERTLRHIEALLVKIADRLGVKPEPKRESAASVSSVTKRADGTVTDNDSIEVPSQLETDYVSSGPMGRQRRVVRFKR